MTAGEFCNRQVVFCEPSEPVIEVARRMRDHHVGSLVVLDGARRPVGIVTDRDLAVRALAAGVDPGATPVSAVMSSPVSTAPESEPLERTLQRMRVQGVRRLPVVDAQGALQGLVAMDDLLELFARQVAELVALEARELRREKAPV
jgi:CBS domain-containing protein